MTSAVNCSAVKESPRPAGSLLVVLKSVLFSASFLPLFSSKPNTLRPGWPRHWSPCPRALESQGEHPEAQSDLALPSLQPAPGSPSRGIRPSQPFGPAPGTPGCPLSVTRHLCPLYPGPVASSCSPHLNPADSPSSSMIAGCSVSLMTPPLADPSPVPLAGPELSKTATEQNVNFVVTKQRKNPWSEGETLTAPGASR